MPEANAFERLIERVVFDTEKVSAEETSRSWILLQALLAGNVQARDYTRRLVMRRSAESPSAHGEGIQRLGALLDQWSLDDGAPLSSSGISRPGGGSSSATGSFSACESRGPSKDESEPLRGSMGRWETPPRRFGVEVGAPMLSESPMLPADRGQLHSSQTSLAVTSTTHHGGPAADSASTIPFWPRESSRHIAARQSMETDISSSQVRCSSLDAWLRLSDDSRASTEPSRSLSHSPGRLHAAPEAEKSIAVPFSVSVLGSREISFDLSRRGIHCQFVDDNSDSDQRDGKAMERLVSKDDALRFDGKCKDDAYPWCKTRFDGKGTKDQSTFSATTVLHRWVKSQQDSFVKQLLEATRQLKSLAMCRISWRRLSERLSARCVEGFRLCAALTNAEVVCRRSVANRMKLLASRYMHLIVQEACTAIRISSRPLQGARHLACASARCRLRSGLEHWSKTTRSICKMELQLQTLFDRGYRARRGQILTELTFGLRSSSSFQERQEALTRMLVQSLQSRILVQFRHAFAQMQVECRRFHGKEMSRFGQSQGAALAYLASLFELRKSLALASWRSAALRCLSKREKMTWGQSTQWATKKCLQNAWREWRAHHDRGHRAKSVFLMMTLKQMRSAFQQLILFSVARCQDKVVSRQRILVSRRELVLGSVFTGIARIQRLREAFAMMRAEQLCSQALHRFVSVLQLQARRFGLRGWQKSIAFSHQKSLEAEAVSFAQGQEARKQLMARTIQLNLDRWVDRCKRSSLQASLHLWRSL